MKKIIGFSGSPIKDSNTDRMVMEILKSSGLDYECIKLSEKTIHPCKGCKACCDDNICKVNDDFPEIAEKIKEADGLVIGAYTPYCMIDASTKALLERFWSLRHNKALNQGKYLITVVSSLMPPFSAAVHQSIVMESLMERMMHVDSIDINGSAPCNTCGYGDACGSSAVKMAHGENACASVENCVPVEKQPAWEKGIEAGKLLGALVNGEANYQPSPVAQAVMAAMGM